MATSDITPALRIDKIDVSYDSLILAVRGLSLTVAQGGMVALLGANGAGKSTTLKAISGLLGPERGAVTSGKIELFGKDAARLDATDRVQDGLSLVMEGRRCFPHLTVEENLFVGAHSRRLSLAETRREAEKIYTYFPRLKERRHSKAGYTSGGEQQMCSIGRALMASPRIVLLDELSMGLAPIIVAEIFEIIGRIRAEQNVSLLVAEQNSNLALRYADYGYVVNGGQVSLEGPAEELLARSDVKSAYLGGGERRSFRTMQSLKRRRDWRGAV